MNKQSREHAKRQQGTETGEGLEATAPSTAVPRWIRDFDLDDPKLDKEIKQRALGSGGFPYPERMHRKPYEHELNLLQIELLKLQRWVNASGTRIVILFEGRDASGKGSTISRFRAHINPRSARVVALSKPSETEAGQWYFQRYVENLPTRGEIVMFDRSWYNRAGVERVMGFCSDDDLAHFFRAAPAFESMLVNDGIHLIKFYLAIGREMQLKRFHRRRHDPLRVWKISDIDLSAIRKWDDYSKAAEDTFRFTHTAIAPWHVVKANDKRRARIAAIRTVLSAFDYTEKDHKFVGQPDPLIVGCGPSFFEQH